MSQIHTTAMTGGPIGTVVTVTGNVGGPVMPDMVGNLNLVGTDPILVTGNPALNTLTISVATATELQTGVTTLATNAETIAGGINNKVVVPTGLAAKLGAQTANAIAYGGGAANALNWLGPLANGELIIGSTGLAPVTATLTAGNNIGIANGAGTVTVNVNGTTNHAVQVGNATNSLTSLAVGVDGAVLIGATGANPAFAALTSLDGTVVFTPGANTLDLSASTANVLQNQIYYVGKHGNDANTGRNIEQAVLTFGQAIVLATAAIPSAVNRFAIVCFDDGIYAEALMVPQYVDVFAPNATLTGTIVVNDDSSIKLSRLEVADTTIGVSKAAGSAYTNVDIDYVNCSGTGIGFLCVSGFLNCHWKELYVANGFGVGDLSALLAHMHVRGGDIYVTGTGTGIARANTGSIVGHVDHIADVGGGTGTGIAVFDGTIAINVNTINNNVAYNVNGATSILHLFANSITGTRTVAAGGTDDHWVPPLAMANGQLVIGAGVGVDPVVANITSAGGTITVTDGAGSIDLATGAAVATSYLTDDAASAIPALGVLTVAGGANIATSSAASTVTIAVDGTTDHTVQIGNATGSLTSLAAMANGELVIGSTGADPVIASITAGAGITVTPGAGSITIASTVSSLVWTVEAVNLNMVVNHGYIANKAGTLELTLPAVSVVGDVVRVTGMNTALGWQIKQNAGNTIYYNGSTTTPGVGGSITSSAIHDSVELVCITANADWIVVSGTGNVTIV